jgi:putative acetyltransferase
MQRPSFSIFSPTTKDEIDQVRSLFVRYAAGLGVKLCFQNFDTELATLPASYVAPKGALLAVRSAVGDAIGCCALRPLDTGDYPNAAEMKRLFVLPEHRGHGLGRLLVEAILDAARQAAYDCVLLDTLTEMETARALYFDLGFSEIPPYYHNPIAGAHYLRVTL